MPTTITNSYGSKDGNSNSYHGRKVIAYPNKLDDRINLTFDY